MTKRVLSLYSINVATQAERRKQTRAKLLEAGTAVLVEQGAAGFSTVAVADKAELSNGAVFNHFDTRLDLLAATVEHSLAELRESFAQSFTVVGADATATELLTILWQAMSRPEQTAVVEVFAQARTNPELQALLTPIVEDHHRHIKTLVDFLAEVQVEGAQVRSGGEGGDPPVPGERGITPDFVSQMSFLFIYAMVGLTINNEAGAALGSHETLIELGQRVFDAVDTGGG